MSCSPALIQHQMVVVPFYYRAYKNIWNVPCLSDCWCFSLPYIGMHLSSLCAVCHQRATGRHQLLSNAHHLRFQASICVPSEKPTLKGRHNFLSSCLCSVSVAAEPAEALLQQPLSRLRRSTGSAIWSDIAEGSSSALSNCQVCIPLLRICATLWQGDRDRDRIGYAKTLHDTMPRSALQWYVEYTKAPKGTKEVRRFPQILELGERKRLTSMKANSWLISNARAMQGPIIKATLKLSCSLSYVCLTVWWIRM